MYSRHSLIKHLFIDVWPSRWTDWFHPPRGSVSLFAGQIDVFFFYCGCITPAEQLTHLVFISSSFSSLFTSCAPFYLCSIALCLAPPPSLTFWLLVLSSHRWQKMWNVMKSTSPEDKPEWTVCPTTQFSFSIITHNFTFRQHPEHSSLHLCLVSLRKWGAEQCCFSMWWREENIAVITVILSQSFIFSTCDDDLQRGGLTIDIHNKA